MQRRSISPIGSAPRSAVGIEAGRIRWPNCSPNSCSSRHLVAGFGTEKCPLGEFFEAPRRPLIRAEGIGLATSLTQRIAQPVLVSAGDRSCSDRSIPTGISKPLERPVPDSTHDEHLFCKTIEIPQAWPVARRLLPELGPRARGSNVIHAMPNPEVATAPERYRRCPLRLG
jgi:hypothetical protein